MTNNNDSPSKGNFIYVVGEKQTAIIPESQAVFDFANENMKSIESDELVKVISSVFGKGEFFVGPPEVLTSIIHEFINRSEEYKSSSGFLDRHCIILTACRLIKGEIAVRVTAISPLDPKSELTLEDSEKFYTFLLEAIPKFENNFTKEPYAQDSKLVSILKESILYHQKKADS